jgi:hypothetical protein
MKLSTLLLAVCLGSAATAAASAATYDITIASDDGTITGVMTGDGSGLVTSFTGTATGFYGGAAIFNGPVTLGQSSGGPTFPIDDKFTTTPDYFSTGDGSSGGGLGLTTANAGTNYNFRIYDYTDTNNNYGLQTGWFVSSGYNRRASRSRRCRNRRLGSSWRLGSSDLARPATPFAAVRLSPRSDRPPKATKSATAPSARRAPSCLCIIVHAGDVSQPRSAVSTSVAAGQVV